jgi:hypothetical protein
MGKKKELIVSIIILVLVALSGFAVGYIFAKETNPAPIIIEKVSG